MKLPIRSLFCAPAIHTWTIKSMRLREGEGYADGKWGDFVPCGTITGDVVRARRALQALHGQMGGVLVSAQSELGERCIVTEEGRDGWSPAPGAV